MFIRELCLEEKVASGFTHAAQVTFEDLTETATATAQTLQVFDVVDGTIVRNFASRVVTAFSDASDAAFNDVAVTGGDGGSANRFLVSQQVNVNGTEVMGKVGTGFPYIYLADDTIDVVFNSMTGKALNDLDAGEMWFFAALYDIDKLILDTLA